MLTQKKVISSRISPTPQLSQTTVKFTGKEGPYSQLFLDFAQRAIPNADTCRVDSIMNCESVFLVTANWYSGSADKEKLMMTLQLQCCIDTTPGFAEAQLNQLIIQPEFRSYNTHQPSLIGPVIKSIQKVLSETFPDTPTTFLVRASGLNGDHGWGGYVWAKFAHFESERALVSMKNSHITALYYDIFPTLYTHAQSIWSDLPELREETKSYPALKETLEKEHPFITWMSSLAKLSDVWVTPMDVRNTHLFMPDGKTPVTLDIPHKTQPLSGIHYGMYLLIQNPWTGIFV